MLTCAALEKLRWFGYGVALPEPVRAVLEAEDRKQSTSLAPLVRLGYGRMLWMALPYTVTLSATALVATVTLL